MSSGPRYGARLAAIELPAALRQCMNMNRWRWLRIKAGAGVLADSRVFHNRTKKTGPGEGPAWIALPREKAALLKGLQLYEGKFTLKTSIPPSKISLSTPRG